MKPITLLARKTRATLEIYWELVRIIIPVAIATEFLVRTGVIAAISPAFTPLMDLYGLPPGLTFAWLVGMLVGIWSAVPMIFVLVPVSELTSADMTVFSALLLFAHALPIEQKIIQKAGPHLLASTAIRLIGGMIFAAILHQICAATGWLSEPLAPTWIPMAETVGWSGFLLGLAETLAWMLAILVVLAWGLDLLKLSGAMTHVNRALGPVFGAAGISGDARQFTAVGFFLGVSYGGGLLIREARSGAIAPRQIFLSCVFMGFAHGMIEDTLLVMALGADFTAIFVLRMLFALVATALIARLLATTSDRAFFGWLFTPRGLDPNAGEAKVPA